MTYAIRTAVPVTRSRVAIERELEKHHASHIGVMTEPGRAQVAFTIGTWSVLFRMALPTEVEAGKHGSSVTACARWLEARQRERWRALFLVLKAKLVAVESGVETFEEAFLAHLVTDHSGTTMGERVLPALRAERRMLTT